MEEHTSTKMKNSVKEADIKQPLRSPPPRRRSTFFERRDSIVPKIQSENLDLKDPTNTSESEKCHRDLQIYYDKLLTEKQQWKKEVNDRRCEYHDLREQVQMVINEPSSSKLSYSVLSNEDCKFLMEQQQEFSKLTESVKKLHESVEFTRALYKRAQELDDVIMVHCDGKLETIKNYILENSTVEPLD